MRDFSSSIKQFSTLKELYDHIVTAKGAPLWIIYGGEEFRLIYDEDYEKHVYLKDEGQIIFDQRNFLMIHYTGNKGVDWYSPLELLSKDNVERTMVTIVRHLMYGDSLWWVKDFNKVVFIEAIRNDIKDAVELWDYIRSTEIAIENQDFIERISDGLQK